jgi:uncharacterized membrane protein YcfT
MSTPLARVPWIDIAKGVAITLVVVHHALQFLGAYGWSPGPLYRADAGLTTMRMPLFFAVSGLLAANGVRTFTFASLWQRRMLLLVYLYVLWGLVRAIWFSFVPWPLGELDPWMQLLVSPVQPWSGLWYLYALALYMALAWAIRSLPVWSQLAGGAVVSALFASGFIQLGVGYTWRSIGTYFFFFLLGMHARGLILRFAERVTWVTGTATLLGYAALAIGIVFIPQPLRWIATLPVAVVGVAAGVALAALLAKSGILGRGFAAIGMRTLPVYVLHVLVISALAPLLPAGIVPTLIAAPLLAAVAIAACLGIYSVTARVPGLFTLAPGLAKRPVRAADS